MRIPENRLIELSLAHTPPNGLRLSGRRKPVGCSRGLGDRIILRTAGQFENGGQIE